MAQERDFMFVLKPVRRVTWTHKIVNWTYSAENSGHKFTMCKTWDFY